VPVIYYLSQRGEYQKDGSGLSPNQELAARFGEAA